MSRSFDFGLSRPADEAEEFLYIVTHDLKAFARAMCTIPDWIHEDITAQGQPLPAESAENLAMLRDYAHRLDETLTALTALSRVGRRSDPPAVHELQALVTEECAALPATPRLNCHIACEGVEVLGPGNDLHTLFAAVLGNVAAHHDRNFGMLRVEAVAKNDRIQVTLTDDGPGIPDSQHQHVFKPLSTLRPKGETGHSGLGLAIARKVVRNLGGDAHLLPAPKARGCRLRFDLPAAAATP